MELCYTYVVFYFYLYGLILYIRCFILVCMEIIYLYLSILIFTTLFIIDLLILVLIPGFVYKKYKKNLNV